MKSHTKLHRAGNPETNPTTVKSFFKIEILTEWEKHSFSINSGAKTSGYSYRNKKEKRNERHMSPHITYRKSTQNG